MIISILGILLGIAITSLWIFIPQNKIPKEKQISKGVYIRSVLLGVTLCSLCIIILEIIWDRATGIQAGTVDTIWKILATSFLRAALIEELMKFLFVRRVLKKHKPADKLQYMLLAGTIGMGYSITEKLLVSPGAILLGAVFSFHIMFQFIMGGYLYEAAQTEDAAKKRRMTILAYLVPFLIHGGWDTAMFVGEQSLDSELGVITIIGMLAFFVLIAAGIIFEVKVIQYIRKLLHSEELTGEAAAIEAASL